MTHCKPFTIKVDKLRDVNLAYVHHPWFNIHSQCKFNVHKAPFCFICSQVVYIVVYIRWFVGCIYLHLNS